MRKIERIWEKDKSSRAVRRGKEGRRAGETRGEERRMRRERDEKREG